MENVSFKYFLPLLIGFIPAFIILLITESFHWSREKRNFLNQKYEQALSALYLEHSVFDRYIDIVKEVIESHEVLNQLFVYPSAFDELKARFESLQSDLLEPNQNVWKIDILVSHDKSLISQIVAYEAIRVDLIKSLCKESKSTKNSQIIFELADSIAPRYQDASQNLVNSLHVASSKLQDNPFCALLKYFKKKLFPRADFKR